MKLASLFALRRGELGCQQSWCSEGQERLEALPTQTFVEPGSGPTFVGKYSLSFQDTYPSTIQVLMSYLETNLPFWSTL